MNTKGSIRIPIIIILIVFATLGASGFYIFRQAAVNKNTQKEEIDFETRSRNDADKTADRADGVINKAGNKSATGLPAHKISSLKTEPDNSIVRNKGVEEVPSPKQEVAKIDTTVKAMAPSTSLETPPLVFPFKAEWTDAVVNLYCKNKTYGTFVSSGTGVVVDPRGIILTNAHVADNFLFNDSPAAQLSYPSSLGLPLNSLICTVRTGSPAYPRYRAQLLYIPGEWVRESVRRLYFPPSQNEDYVYGIKDYAFLVITEPINQKESLPGSFSYLRLYAGAPPPLASLLYLMGYPARFLGDATMENHLSQIASSVTLHKVKSFKDSQTSDLFAFPGSVAGQSGSSGGAIVQNGELIGVPTFYQDYPGPTTDDNILNAITIVYINKDLRNDTGMSLIEFLGRPNPVALSNQFFKEGGREYQCRYAETLNSHQGFQIPAECKK